MNQVIRLFAGFFVAGVIGWTSIGAEKLDRHVVLITIDGFPSRMFYDQKASLPHLRALAAEGVVAEGMHVSNPSVTWPNHTTLVTGRQPAKHSVLFNGILERGGTDQPVKIDPRKDKSELVKVPTVYDLLHEEGYRTGAIDWPCTRGSKALNDDFPDTPEPLSHSTPEFVEDLVKAGILEKNDEAWFRGLSGPRRDEIWTKAACYLITKRMPNLLLVHLLNTDGIHHKYGPESPASYTAIGLADQFVGQIVEAINAAGLRDKTTIIVTADHGFAGATKVLQPNVLLRKAGMLELNKSGGIASARVQVVPEGGTGLVYFNNAESREADRAKVLELLKGQEGVAKVITPEEYAKYGYPSPSENQGMGELVIVPEKEYAVSGTASGDDVATALKPGANAGYHGLISGDARMNALFIAAGNQIKKGQKIGMIKNVDVAPTIFSLFGKALPDSDGKVLNEILVN